MVYIFFALATMRQECGRYNYTEGESLCLNTNERGQADQNGPTHPDSSLCDLQKADEP